uniref:Retrotransposon gag domain-containing protein n=1 Tax=Panagrolaimus davidi TaxID=227884 RepID=A0A914QHY5_9BILA
MPPKPEPEAAGVSVWPPHAYDGKVRLDVWLTLLEMYMTAKGFEDDSNKQMRMALLQHIGIATLEKIIDWISPAKPQDKTYDELVALLKEKFSIEKNLTALRFQFLTEKQREGQSLQEYLAHMTQLYGQSSMAQMTVQQFGVLAILQGISSNELRQYLMGPENDISDMSKLQKLACSFEQSRLSLIFY